MWNGALQVVVAIIVALDIVVPLSRASDDEQWAQMVADAHARDARELASSLRMFPMFSFHSGYNFIGDLANNGYWTSVLPLEDEQAAVIKELDRILFSGDVGLRHLVADHLETVPADYRGYLDRSKKRQLRAVWHGQQMTLTGLLTERQATFVFHRYLSNQGANALHDETIQALLRIDSAQKKELERIRVRYNKATAPIFIASMDSTLAPGRDIDGEIKNYKSSYDTATRGVLRPEQRATLDRLLAKHDRLISAPPMASVASTNPDAAKSQYPSELFRRLEADGQSLELTAEQKNLVASLIAITRLGAHWISLAPADSPMPNSNDHESAKSGDAAKKKGEFIKHAEEVAKLGILSEEQASKLSSLMK